MPKISLQKAHSSYSPKRLRKYAFIFLGVIAVAILLAPKLQTRWQVWQEERRLHSFANTLENISPPVTSVPEISSPENPAENFLQKLAAFDEKNLPKEVLLNIPFICQNPFQDSAGWDFHDNSCEEAALLQVMLSLEQRTVTATEADQTLRDMIAWQEKPEHFGAHIDLYGEDMKRFIIGYYDLPSNAVVHLQNLDEPLLKKVLALGYPLVLPIEGKLLKNPFYQYPGYHMLTLIGYSGETAITNDVGTKRGEKYPYAWARLLAANQPAGNDGFVIVSLPK